MLLRPTVLATPAIAAAVAAKERNKLSGIRQGELQLRQEEEDRYKKIDAQLLRDAEKRAKDAKKEAEAEAKEKAKLKASGITNAPTLETIPPLED
jgi:hypothetical protein